MHQSHCQQKKFYLPWYEFWLALLNAGIATPLAFVSLFYNHTHTEYTALSGDDDEDIKEKENEGIHHTHNKPEVTPKKKHSKKKSFLVQDNLSLMELNFYFFNRFQKRKIPLF